MLDIKNINHKPVPQKEFKPPLVDHAIDNGHLSAKKPTLDSLDLGHLV